MTKTCKHCGAIFRVEGLAASGQRYCYEPECGAGRREATAKRRTVAQARRLDQLLEGAFRAGFRAGALTNSTEDLAWFTWKTRELQGT